MTEPTAAHPPPSPDAARPVPVPPQVLDAVRRDLGDWRAWRSRIVVMLAAVAAGWSVVAFTWLAERALEAFAWLRAGRPWLPFLWTPALTAAIVAATRRWWPGASGSGIPQVMAALSHRVGEAERPLFVSLRLSLAKIVLTAGGLLGGLAIGREGPSVQIAAGVMLHARRWLPRAAPITPHGLLVAGGAAGIAAAFNAPLAGVMFAIEELARRLEERSSGLVVTAIVLAGLMAVSSFGNATYFGVIRVPPLDLRFLMPAAAVIVAAGALGGVFSRLLLQSLAGGADRFSRLRAAHPVAFAAGCGLVIALVGWASDGASFGSGYGSTRHLLEGKVDAPFLYVTLRLVATWMACWAGVPGGLFAPALAIGAGVGHDVAAIAGDPTLAPALIALGMAGFLAALTQAPLTAFIIVMEMVDGHAMVLSLMAAALGASLVARWIAPPLYPALAALQERRIPVAVA